MELLVHLNKRIKSRPKIQLPVETLLVQYQDPAAASFVTVRFDFFKVFMSASVILDLFSLLRDLIRNGSLTWGMSCDGFISLQNFTIIYIKMGYPRLEVGKQCELAPTLLTAMEGKPQPQQDRWGDAHTRAHIQNGQAHSLSSLLLISAGVAMLISLYLTRPNCFLAFVIYLFILCASS